MKWSITLLLPLLVVAASCGTSASFSQQRFQDGIYVSAYPTENVKLKTEEDFRRDALRNIRERQMLAAFDSLKVEYRDVYPGTLEYQMYFDIVPLIALNTGFSWAFNNWYWRRWHLGWSGYGPVGFYDPFWISSRWDWYLFPFNDPFWNWTYYGRPYYYGPGYYRPWYGPVYVGGGGFRNNLVYTPRNTTQPAGGYRTSGNVVRRGSSDGGSSVAPRTSGQYNYTPRRISGSSISGSGSGTGSRSSSGRTYSPSTSGTASGSGSISTSRRSSSTGGYSGGSTSRSSSSYSGSSSRSSSSYSGGSSSRGSSSYSGGSSRGGGGGRSSGGSGGRR